MRNKIFKSLLLFAAAFMLPVVADAQQYIITKTNGEKVVYKYTDVESIIYSEAQEGEYEFVDLGLSVKWAACNVGSETPEGYGSYFAWGETTTKPSYDWDNCLTDNKPMTDFSGDAAYDAARANWDVPARMPTKEECYELVQKCKWTDETVNGVVGMRVTGPNGNSIFFPAAGYYFGSELLYVGEAAYFWSSTSLEDDNYHAYYLAYYNGNGWCHNKYRGNGHTIRAVSE